MYSFLSFEPWPPLDPAQSFRLLETTRQKNILTRHVSSFCHPETVSSALIWQSTVTYMTATLATSWGWPRRRTGTLAAMARPGSVSLSSSRSVLFVHVLSDLVSMVREKFEKARDSRWLWGRNHVCKTNHCRKDLYSLSISVWRVSVWLTVLTVTPSPARTVARFFPIELQKSVLSQTKL